MTKVEEEDSAVLDSSMEEETEDSLLITGDTPGNIATTLVTTVSSVSTESELSTEKTVMSDTVTAPASSRFAFSSTLRMRLQAAHGGDDDTLDLGVQPTEEPELPDDGLGDRLSDDSEVNLSRESNLLEEGDTQEKDDSN